MNRSSLSWLSAGLMCAIGALAAAGCAQQVPAATKRTFDPALVREQQRRIAAFDSVVRLVNTDSLYYAWQAMLTAPDIKTAYARMACIGDHLSYTYAAAADRPIDRMNDTLWRHADPSLVARMHYRMYGLELGSGHACGPLPAAQAPRWLREWSVYELPKLPPSPDSGATDR
jgi:hypothetical protein